MTNRAEIRLEEQSENGELTAERAIKTEIDTRTE